ncbi:MAG: tetratricopeptide repeat protein [Deltaproteobacteria bacterium]|nr:tetratricopeptide repeat protein [Candidatus Zymogenaceae bacterium]
MKIRAALFLMIMFVFPPIVGAEEASLRSELIRGINLISNGDIARGEKVFASIEDREPTNPAPYIYRAMALMSYPPREGVNEIDRALIEGLLERGIECALGGKWENEKGRVNLLLATAYSLVAQLSLDHKEYLKAAAAALRAEDYLKEAERISPDDPDVRYGVGLVSYGMAEMPPFARSVLSILHIPGDKEQGIEDLKTAAEKGVYTKTSARIALLMIMANIENRYPEAVFYGRELTDEFPNNPELYFPYANALSETGDHEGARTVATALGEKIDDGQPYFDGAIVPRYHHLMGKLLMDEGQYEEAAVELSKALVVRDKNYAWVQPLALARLGMIEDLSRRREKAVGFYRRAIDTHVEGAGIELAEKYLAQPYRSGGGK